MKSEHVELLKYEVAAKGYASYPGIALTEPGADGRIQIMYLHPDRHKNLIGADWRDAVDRALDVLPEGKQADGVAFYRTLEAPVPPSDKLREFLFANFKSETGNETPIDCAIRLLGKIKAKK